MGKALYRKHRPKKLSEIIGQEHITTTLEKAIKSGHISHAYLFTGPRGTGKTSIARILAHEVNNLPYTDDNIHLDIIEIDAASNRRIDEIRELKDRVNIAPTSAKYKVYIIDEVHMLTREAFNALLKTLEEPPEHVIFILATTEAHKLPETIISRTQRFSFKPVDLEKVAEELGRLAKAEKLTIDKPALMQIARHGGGSFRDSISLLDQVRNTSETITEQDVQQALGQAPDDMLSDLSQAVATGNIATIAQILQSARDQGIQAAQIAAQLSQSIRTQLLEGSTSFAEPVAFLTSLLGVSHANSPELALELALYDHALRVKPLTHTEPRANIKQPAPKTLPTPPASAPAKSIEPTKSIKEPKPEKLAEATPTEPESVSVAKQSKPIDMSDATDAPTEGDWQDILDAVKAKHNTLYGIARMAQPQFAPGSITLVFSFPFHHKRVSDARNHAILSKIAEEVTGQKIVVSYALDKAVKAPPNPEASAEPKLDISAITAVFGDAEVLD